MVLPSGLFLFTNVLTLFIIIIINLLFYTKTLFNKIQNILFNYSKIEFQIQIL